MRLESFGYTGGATPVWRSHGHLDTTAQGTSSHPFHWPWVSRGHVVSDQAIFQGNILNIVLSLYSPESQWNKAIGSGRKLKGPRIKGGVRFYNPLNQWHWEGQKLVINLRLYMYTHILFKNQPLETWVKLEDFTLSEIKPVTKRQILFVLWGTWVSRYLEASRMVASTGWGRGKQGLLFNQDRGAAGKHGKVQQMDGGEGCTTMWTYLMPLN